MQIHPHFQALRDRACQLRRQAQVANASLSRYDQVIEQLDAGIHPLCRRCGERIEVDRLMSDPCCATCWSCSRNPA